MKAHPTALIDPAAEIEDDVEVGPYVIIEGPVRVGSGCKIGAHAQIYGEVMIAEGNEIGPGAIIGGDPQSIGFDSAINSGVEIGPENLIREHVTIHRGSSEGARTVLGRGNFLMAGAHLGHDVVVGDENVIANHCLLGGHVVMGDHCFLGGGSVFHQFIRIGDFAIVRGNGASSKDIPPYLMIAETNKVAGINVIGLRRAGFTSKARDSVKRAYKLLFRSGLNLTQALSVAGERGWAPEARVLIDFLQKETDRGYCLQLLD